MWGMKDSVSFQFTYQNKKQSQIQKNFSYPSSWTTIDESWPKQHYNLAVFDTERILTIENTKS